MQRVRPGSCVDIDIALEINRYSVYDYMSNWWRIEKE